MKAILVLFVLLVPALLATSVVELDSNNFYDVVGKNKYVLLEFYAPWCGHCKRLEPAYEAVADHFLMRRNEVVIARVNGDANGELSRKYNVMGFPTIFWVEPQKTDSSETYSGSRTDMDLIRFVSDRVVAPVESTANDVEQVNRQMLRGNIQTVTGLITPDKLGPTHTHEHLRIAYQKFWSEPKDTKWLKRAHEPISWENLHWVQTYWDNNKHNMELNDDVMAVKELSHFKQAGGSGIVELTTIGIRFPGHAQSLRRIAELSDVNVILGTGYYMGPSHPSEMGTMSVDEVANVMIREIMEGVDGTTIRAGVIGELGCSWPLYPGERKVLEAGARAQSVTGSGLIIHPGRNESAPFEIVDILRANGADISRTVMSHLDRTIRDYPTLLKLAQTGVGMEWDMFGMETSFYPPNPRTFMPNDAVRMQFITQLVRDGYGKQIVIGHDIFSKHRLVSFGGHGYAHILENIVPRFRLAGLSEEEISDMLVNNPRRYLTFV